MVTPNNRMWVRRLFTPTLFVMFAMHTAPVCAAETESIVVGTGDPALDPAAVQQAVNAGGTVRLQGTFAFGTTGSVLIGSSVAIVGDSGATIIGGNSANTLLIDAFGASVRIEGVRFQDSGFAIRAHRAGSVSEDGLTFEGGLTIARCRFESQIPNVPRAAIALLPNQPGQFGSISITENELIIHSFASEPPRAWWQSSSHHHCRFLTGR